MLSRPHVQEAIFMVQELMHTSLWNALGEESLQERLRWRNL